MRRFLMAGALSLAAGCGGPSARYTVDDVSIAAVAINDRQPVFAAEQEASIARAERAKEQLDADAASHDVDVAIAERDQAHLEVSKGKVELDAAEKSHDLNRVPPAEKTVKVAEIGEKAANAKIDWLQAVYRWHKRLVDVADEKIGAALSKMELEKAKVAAAKGIRPTKDFNVDTYNNEYLRRLRELEKERKKADMKKAEADKLAKAYDDLRAQADKASKQNK
jgi:hypothetical protein